METSSGRRQGSACVKRSALPWLRRANPARRATGYTNRAQGRSLENEIEAACLIYRRRGIAHIEKVEPAVVPTHYRDKRGRMLFLMTGSGRSDWLGYSQLHRCGLKFESKRIDGQLAGVKAGTYGHAQKDFAQLLDLRDVRHCGVRSFLLLYCHAETTMWLLEDLGRPIERKRVPVRTVNADSTVTHHLPHLIGSRAPRAWWDFLPLLGVDEPTAPPNPPARHR